MKTLTRLGLGIVAIALPILALAAPPNVTGITAVNDNGKVRVSWNAVQSNDIASYRIFYSHASILRNNGLYDDFESVSKTATTHLLQNLPPANELFVSVLAVNSKGEESMYFVEEARVQLGSGTATQSSAAAVSSAAAASSAMPVETQSSAMAVASSQPAMPTTTSGDELRFLAAESVSATGVLLRFSHPVMIQQDQAMNAALIETASGTMLRITRFTVTNTTILVDTVPQQRGVVYRVSVRPFITGRNSANQTIALAGDQDAMLFIGHPTGIAPVPQQSQTQTSSSPATISNKADVTQLRLRAQPDGAKTYKVEVTWAAPEGVIGYQISQSTDGGRTYSQPVMVAKEATAANIPSVTPGTFAIMIKVVYADGISTGIAQVINLPAAGNTQGSVTNNNNGGALPSSGATTWIALTVAAAMIGAMRMRRLAPETI